MRFLRKTQSLRSPYPLRILCRLVSASLNSNWPLFSYTSEKYWLQVVAAKLSLRPAGRQTLHTQGFPHSPSVGDAAQGRFVAPWLLHLRPFGIAKRYVCAAKSLLVDKTISAILFHFSRNATWVQPARFRRWISKTILESSSFRTL